MTLAWTPFLDPLGSHQVWPLLLLPLVVFLTIAYKAVRVPNKGGKFDLSLYAKQTLSMIIQVTIAMITLYLGVWILVDFILPMALA